MRAIVFLLIAALPLWNCGQAERTVSASAILIEDVSVVNVEDGKIAEHQYIVIDSGKIQSIVPAVENPEAYSTRIEGSGKYVIPGLAEMHAHIPSPPTSPERVEETLFLYLSNGITTIRGMLGHPNHLELRQRAQDGNLLSPRIFTSSPSLNGNTIPTAAAADSLVRKYAAEGYDFLKIHPGVLLEPFDSLVAASRDTGIPFSGHVPVAVGIRHALQSGYASIDHVDGFLEGLVPVSAGVNPSDNGFFGFAFTQLADTSAIDDLVNMAEEHGVWIVPTQSLFERWFAPASADSLLGQAEMQYMPASTLENWKRIKLETTGPESGFNAEQWELFTQIRRRLIRGLQDNGPGLLLGSDAPQLFNVPGFSIHHEIDAMLKAGLSPLEILQSGTINPALFFDMEDEFGSIAAGKSADLILLPGNPLENMGILREPEGVMVRGRWIDKETIRTELSQISLHAKDQ